MRRTTLVLLVLAAAFGLAAGVAPTAPAAEPYACSPKASPGPYDRPFPTESTSLIIDGGLYGMVRARGGGYEFGWSGRPVLTFDEAFRLVGALGVKGDPQRVFNLPEIVGGDYSDGGSIGYFSTYALGNLVSAQLWEKIRKDIRDLDDQICKGNFSELLGWLRTNVHRHGHKYDPQVLVEKVTGSKITPEPYVRYLTKKYSEIYGL